MSLLKDCADHLRADYRNITGNKLGSGHAHELATAFFGYGTAAALQSEIEYPLTALIEAEFLIPDLPRIEQRIQQIKSLPSDLPSGNDLALALGEFLVSTGRFTGKVWRADSLNEHVNEYVHNDPLMIEDALSSEMAETNAFFDELYIDEIGVQFCPEALVVTLDGALNGETHEDRVFHGDKIVFETVMTFDRIAGRVGYRRPNLETSGQVDDADYYDLEDA